MALPILSKAQLRDGINLIDHDEKLIRFGINFGINRSHYNIGHSKQFLSFDSVNVIESINSTGINLAWMVNLNLNQHFDIRTQPLNLIFTEKAFQYTLSKPDRVRKEDSVVTKKVQGITLAFPLQLKFSSDRIANFKVYMLAGGRVEYDLAANAGKKNNDEIITLQKLDYAAEAGIGFHIYFPVFVLTPELKVTYGLKNVLSPNNSLKYSNTIDRLNSRSITLSLTVE
ncbi:outer membrane beta-barrel protein [Ferruginibacter yonginensis]|uniref:Outer membrane beta-barrel protein n=1 Tax=Ferruginibacter yonginensis TaxID=1310416 RepID=A0ABV8QUI4_9BACT